MAKFDLIVRGGRVIDPASGIDGAPAAAIPVIAQDGAFATPAS